MKKVFLGLSLCLGLLPGITHAAVLVPDYYNMPNGYTGSYSYWDESYSGSGSISTDGAALSNGRGDLTDGIIAQDNWFVVEAPAGAGPYVGWCEMNPIISFKFSSISEFSNVRIYLDDSNGCGGVSAPSKIIVNGESFYVSDPSGIAPFYVDLDISNIVSDSLDIELIRNNSWVFASEFEFTGVPEPTSALLLLAGAGLLKRRKA